MIGERVPVRPREVLLLLLWPAGPAASTAVPAGVAAAAAMLAVVAAAAGRRSQLPWRLPRDAATPDVLLLPLLTLACLADAAEPLVTLACLAVDGLAVPSAAPLLTLACLAEAGLYLPLAVAVWPALAA